MSLNTLYGKKRGSYLKLIERFPLRPIHTDDELHEAIAVMDSLLDKENLDRGEEDYLDVLGEIVKTHEDQHIPIEPASDAEVLRYLLELKEVSQAEVARQTAIAVSTISEVLNGKRTLNRRQIGKLAKYFHVSLGVFDAGQ